MNKSKVYYFLSTPRAHTLKQSALMGVITEFKETSCVHLTNG